MGISLLFLVTIIGMVSSTDYIIKLNKGQVIYFQTKENVS